MQEERNQNWELALRRLALHTLSQTSHMIASDASLGHIVSLALESQNLGPLVQDTEHDRSLARALTLAGEPGAMSH
jgi:hypothetical protein